ncbi:MAG: acetyltransferase [Phycisphaerales bacterium]
MTSSESPSSGQPSAASAAPEAAAPPTGEPAAAGPAPVETFFDEFRGHPLGVSPEFSAGHATVGWFSRNEKAGRLLWSLAQATIFRWSFRRADRFRSAILRRFGATIGQKCLIRPDVRIEVPWNLSLGDEVAIGERAILYCLGPVRVGDRTMISQFAHVCAGTHDHTRSDMPLYRVPISIGSDVWLCTETYVAPGVVVGDGVMVGARGNVIRDLPPWTVCVGSPARPVKARAYRRVTPTPGRPPTIEGSAT